MTDLIHGLATGVYAEDLGDQLAATASIGATALTINDVCDFDEAGGWLLLNGSVLEYDSCDDDTNTIALSVALTAAGAVDDTVAVWDQANAAKATVYVAIVGTIDGFEATEPIEAIVPDQLAHALQQSMTDGNGVSVVMHSTGSEWEIAGILGRGFSLATMQYLQGGMTTRTADDQAGIDILGGDSPAINIYGTGGVFGDGAQGMSIQADASGGVSQFYAGIAGETPGFVNPGQATVAGDVIPFLDISTSDLGGGSSVGSRAKIRLLGNTALQDASINLSNVLAICDEIEWDSASGGPVDITGHSLTADKVIAVNPDTTTNAANVRYAPGGQLVQVTSLSAHKHNQQRVDLTTLEKVLRLTPTSWDNDESTDDNGVHGRTIGLLADDAHELAPEFAEYDENGDLCGIDYRGASVALIGVVAMLTERVTALEQRGR